MKRGPIRSHFWSRTVRKDDQDWRSGKPDQGRRCGEDPPGQSMEISFSSRRPGTSAYSEPQNQRREPCSATPNEPTCTSEDRQETHRNNNKRHSIDENEQQESQQHPTEPCYTNTRDVGRMKLIWKRHQKHRSKNLWFSVLSYNILADGLMQSHTTLYEDCPEWCLDWEYRKKNLLKEILQYNADILCLQEVQADHYSDWFEPELKKAGYKSVYKKRTGDKMDGCATFYKGSTFKLIQEHSLDFCMRDVPIMDRDNIALLAVLQPRLSDGSTSTNTALCITNTHILFNKSRGDIKLLQLTCLFAEIQKTVAGVMNTRLSRRRRVEHCPVILCGDFNMTPFCPLYGLVVRGYLEYEGLNKKALSGQNSPHKRFADRDRLMGNIIPRQLNLRYNCTWVENIQMELEQTQCTESNVQGENWDAVTNDETSGPSTTRRKPWCQNIALGNQQCTVAAETSSKAGQSAASSSSVDEWPTLQASAKAIPCSTCRDVTQTGECRRERGAAKGLLPTPSQQPLTTPNPGPCNQSSGTFTHGLRFWSAYRHQFPNGEPEISTYHEREPSCTVDYIFISPGGGAGQTPGHGPRHSVLELCGVLGLLTEEQLQFQGGLPNEKLSSDHLALQASFLLHL